MQERNQVQEVRGQLLPILKFKVNKNKLLLERKNFLQLHRNKSFYDYIIKLKRCIMLLIIVQKVFHVKKHGHVLKGHGFTKVLQHGLCAAKLTPSLQKS